jgi:hypothetical protein
MAIQSVSQPVGQIINLRRNEINTPGSTGWYIDGVKWTGAIRTVGSGQMFTTLQSAVDSAYVADEECLFLVSPGTYTASSSALAKQLYFRGLGTVAGDTIITGRGFETTNVFLENIWVYFLFNVAHQGSSVIAGDTLVINKCILGNSDPTNGYDWPLAASGAISVNIGYTLLQPTIAQAYWNSIRHIINGNRSTISLNKVSFGPMWWWVSPPGEFQLLYTFHDEDCTGVYAVDDKAASGTTGYGPDYGTYRITQGTTYPSMISTSQPIGDIIRLRRGALNAPVDPHDWYIDGVLWTGAIRTVGSGKEFATLAAAVADANTESEDCLYIVDPGNYTDTFSAEHSCYIRGAGGSYSDTRWDIPNGQLAWRFIIPGEQTYFFENITVTSPETYDEPAIRLPAHDVIGSGAVCIANKCEIGIGTSPNNYYLYAFRPNSTSQPNNTHLSISYSNLLGHYYQIAHMDKSLMILLKVACSEWPLEEELLPPFTYDCWGVYISNDSAILGTAGYGPDYGSFRIIQGPPVATTDLSSIAQLIGQTGIRLRRNFSNIPGE